MSFRELIEKSPHKTAMTALMLSILTPMAGFILWLTGIIGSNVQADYSELKDRVFFIEEDCDTVKDEIKTQMMIMSTRLTSIETDIAWIKKLFSNYEIRIEN